MIAAVNGGVTIETRPQQQLRRRRRPARLRRQAAPAECRGSVKAAGVTALAKPWRAHFQQWRDIRAVRDVAIAAIIRRRWMFPQVRPALVGMTDVAGFVDCVFDQQLRSGRSVRIVAIRAGYFARCDRMSGEVMNLRALRLVTGKADFALRVLRERLVLRLVDFMARCARDVVAWMHASRPETAFAGVVAVKAGAALYLGG